MIVCCAVLAANFTSGNGLGPQMLRLDLISFLRHVGTSDASVTFTFIGVTVMVLAGLLVGIRAAGAISGERERRTWDGLLMTPLDANQLVRGKLWGIIDGVRPYLFSYTVPAAILAAVNGPVSLLAILFWWLAAWILMYFTAAIALENSVRSSSSWRSLLFTLISVPRVLFLRFALYAMPIGFFVALPVYVLEPVLISIGVAPAIIVIYLTLCVTGVLIFVQAEISIEKAVLWLAKNERIPQIGAGKPLLAMRPTSQRKIATGSRI